jgi:DNA polymerase III subunit epsilon
MNFTAIDFETANNKRYSACSVGLVKVKNNKIVKSDYFLIRPPQGMFTSIHTGIHGISYEIVKNQPTFGKLWPKIRPYFRGVDFIAAHNVGFDSSVLKACCKRYNIRVPQKEFRCTMKMSKEFQKKRSARLTNVCRRLKITIKKHHNAYHDAHACARIMIKWEKYL